MTRVVVCGAGALGSHFVLLGRNLEADWTVIDDDKLEAKNRKAQHYGIRQSGNKAVALSRGMSDWGLHITPVPRRLVPDNVEILLQDAALVVDCFDNQESRLLVQNFVRARSIPCLHGALAADAQYGRVVWDERFVPDGAAPGAVTCEDGQALPFIGVVASLLVRSAQVFLADGTRHGYEINPSGVFRT